METENFTNPGLLKLLQCTPGIPLTQFITIISPMLSCLRTCSGKQESGSLIFNFQEETIYPYLVQIPEVKRQP